VGGQCHAPAALPPRKRPGACCIGGWMGPRAEAVYLYLYRLSQVHVAVLLHENEHSKFLRNLGLGSLHPATQCYTETSN